MTYAKADPKGLRKVKSPSAAHFLDAYGMCLRDAEGNPVYYSGERDYYVVDAEYNEFMNSYTGFFRRGQNYLA